MCHVLAYADMLFGWQLFIKRSELLKSINREIVPPDLAENNLGKLFLIHVTVVSHTKYRFDPRMCALQQHSSRERYCVSVMRDFFDYASVLCLSASSER